LLGKVLAAQAKRLAWRSRGQQTTLDAGPSLRLRRWRAKTIATGKSVEPEGKADGENKIPVALFLAKSAIQFPLCVDRLVSGAFQQRRTCGKFNA
jgi:hypothetical protein